MVLLTMIARLADGLPLAASMQEDEQVKKMIYFASGVDSCVFPSIATGFSCKRFSLVTLQMLL